MPLPVYLSGVAFVISSRLSIVITFQLLSYHTSLVFVRVGRRPALFLITCVSVSVYLSEASAVI